MSGFGLRHQRHGEPGELPDAGREIVDEPGVGGGELLHVRRQPVRVGIDDQGLAVRANHA
jgi:hypothetical protein